MSDAVYPYAHVAMAKGELDITKLKAALVTDSYKPSKTHKYWSEVDEHELSGGFGYTEGGQGVIDYDVTINSQGVVVHKCRTMEWVARGGTLGPVRYGVIYDSSSKVLLYLFDPGKEKSSDDTIPLKLRTNKSGLFTIG